MVFVMQFKGRSLYNLLKINLKEDATMKVEPWQVLNYRELSVQDLLSHLQKLGISLTEESFLLYAENCDTPEDMLECLWVKEDDLALQDKTYLLIFELWRRWIPEKQSLSIFCDELDEWIGLYDEGQLENEEALQTALTELEDILDQSVDQGAEPQEIFQSVMCYMAHDVEEFLYDYILDLMDSSNELYASELIDGMSPYVGERKWFDLLKARLFSLANSPETSIFVARLLEQSEEDPDFGFLMEMGTFLVQREDLSLFKECVKQMLPLIENQEDISDILKLIAEVFHYMDKEEIAANVEKYMKQVLSLEMQEGIKIIKQCMSELR